MLFSFARRSIPVAILLVILLASVSKGEEIKIGNILLKSNSNVPIVSPKLNQLYQQIPGDSTVKVWVFFTDKAVFTPENYYKSIENCRTNANPRVLRRIKLRAKNKNFDFTDIPVAEEYVKKIEEMGLKIRVKSKWLNAVSLYANNEQLESLSQLPFVKSIDKVARYKRVEPEVAEVSIPKAYTTPKGTLLDYGASYPQLAQIDVPALHNLGYNGSGVLVCMMDGGFQKDHPAFARAFAESRVLAEYDFINNDSNTQNQPGDPSNQDVHGTYTWSALGGEVEGELYGPAYKADFILAKTEDVSAEYPTEEDNWVAGAEWAESLGADIISSSLGYNDWYTYQDMDGKTAKTTIAADLAASKGTLVVNAAGNERCSGGPSSCWYYIIAPADGESVLTVGAVDINGNISSFSSAGPTYDGRIKPDVVACGVSTYCAVPGGSYGRVSGTSLSTPLVAGAAAILFQVDSTLSPMDVINSLRNYANRADNPDTVSYVYGWGIIDAYASAGFSGVALSTNWTAYPNPFSDSVTISRKGERGIDAPDPNISIHTVAGEVVVKNLPVVYFGTGYEAIWNGKNEKGEEVADGIYLVNVRIGDKSQIVKIAKVSR
jgi:hypothetical protein